LIDFFQTMRRAAIILPLIAALASSHAQDTAPADVAAEIAAAARQSALEKLLAERESFEALVRVIGDARAAGVGEQAILEARFLFHVDKQDDSAIAAMLPEFLKRRASFRLADSAIFSVEEDWLAVVEYVQSIAALEKGDRDAFKKHITEAFWLSPRQAAAFAPHIERLRLDETMRALKIDFAIECAPVAKGEAATLKSLIAGKKALFLHFWSPWSHECETAMPDFITTAEMLSSKGFAVVSLVPSHPKNLLDDAAAGIASLPGANASAWLVDPDGGVLARKLRVQNLPTMVIVSNDGRVLFNGSPDDPLMWDELKKIDAGVKRPDASAKEPP
jgi:thiol-disulfide isomerase/thioredoxin